MSQEKSVARKAKYDRKEGINETWKKSYTRGARGAYGSRPDSPGDPEAPSCRGFGNPWPPDGSCGHCGRHWTDIFNTKDHKRNPHGPNGVRVIPSHKTKGVVNGQDQTSV